MQNIKGSFLLVIAFMTFPIASALAQSANANKATAMQSNGGALSASIASEEKPQLKYRFGPPNLSVPTGEPGAIKRSLMQFYDWTLICDAKFKEKKEVCNVSQAAWTENNQMFFSWSLATTPKGTPFFLLRITPDADTKKPVELTIAETKEKVEAKYLGCDKQVCLAQTIVSPPLARAISDKRHIIISYQTARRGNIKLTTSLNGLQASLSSFK